MNNDEKCINCSIKDDALNNKDGECFYRHSIYCLLNESEDNI